MAKLNIAERRLPQDGRIRLAVRGKEIDFRVSTTPAIHGESVVLRILDRGNLALDFEALGFDDTLLPQFMEVLNRPHGIVLVTGPTGSGKTTTLYAALIQLNSPDRKILTVEDPVEYVLDGINQVQMKPDIGLTFATALRSFLRQDPDIMMIGEIRDLETAQIAVQAALTGHLVLSTVHTNDAGSAMTRLLDMGIENYLLTSTMNAVLGQRLVRRLCDKCREPYEPTSRTCVDASICAPLGTTDQLTLYRPEGCPACNGIGYRRPHDDPRADGNERRDPLAGAAPRRGARNPDRGDPQRHADHVCPRHAQGTGRHHDDRGSVPRHARHVTMTRFAYRALSASGDIVDGEIDGPDVKSVIALLNEQALLPIQATEKRPSAGPSFDLSFGRANTFPAGDLPLFIQQLTRLLQASLPLDRSLEILTTLMEDKRTRRIVQRLLEKVRDGSSLAEAMAAEEQAFPSVCVSMVRAGEEGGALQRGARARRRLPGAVGGDPPEGRSRRMIYPAAASGGCDRFHRSDPDLGAAAVRIDVRRCRRQIAGRHQAGDGCEPGAAPGLVDHAAGAGDRCDRVAAHDEAIQHAGAARSDRAAAADTRQSGHPLRGRAGSAAALACC